MKFFIVLAVFALIALALYQKWQRIPPQTKQMWSMLFGMAGAVRQAKKQARANSGGQTADGVFAEQARKSPNQPSKSLNLMRACDQCGLHVLESEGVLAHGKFYCSREHAQ